MTDADWMHRALHLAERGRGSVEPNPMVGAVVVRDGRAVGEGWHQKYGEAHAELHALAAAGDAAHGATLYVTLEPCCHHGKTLPCTDAVVRAGVGRVIAAMSDPFPQVFGRGAATLRAAGVGVEVGVCEPEARRLNAPYLTLIEKGRPWVIAKWAMTLDGKIATRSGDSKWISGPAARRIVHELRGRVDGVLVGILTALNDNPRLTARPPGARVAARVVLDSRCRLPPTWSLAKTAREIPVIVAATAAAPSLVVENLRLTGCEVLTVPANAAGRTDPAALLAELGRRRWTNLLVEGGAGILGALRDADAIDEVYVFIAPRLAGGAEALGPVGGIGVEKIAEAVTLSEWTAEVVEGDVLIHGRR
jgi:diaminohydroxyphosphoribosylaminopyrimidine deaminase/5-amino-6-(5-phosphoribosylamino)uracil reductase